MDCAISFGERATARRVMRGRQWPEPSDFAARGDARAAVGFSTRATCKMCDTRLIPHKHVQSRRPIDSHRGATRAILASPWVFRVFSRNVQNVRHKTGISDRCLMRGAICADGEPRPPLRLTRRAGPLQGGLFKG